MMARLLTVLCAIALLVAVPRSAGATSCAFPTPEFGAEYSDVVFEAVFEGDSAPNMARLRVTKVYRGTVPAEVAAAYGGMKGFPAFVVGKRYLVWAFVKPDGVWVHLCGPTHELPAPKMFTEGPWKGWSVEEQFGPARKPGGTLAAAPKGSATPTPATPPPEPPPPIPATSSQPAEPASSTGREAVPPSPAPPAASAEKGGGCAGCSHTQPAPDGWLVMMLGLGALAIARRQAL